MSITAEQLRQAVLQVSGVGWGQNNGVYTMSARDTLTVTIPAIANSVWLGNETLQRWLYLPDEADATDRQKPAGEMTVATGVVNNVGVVWTGSGSADEQIEIFQYLPPDDVFNITVEALKRFPQRVLSPLGTFLDSDMDTTVDATSWTATTAGLSKVTAAANVFSGVRGLFVDLSGGAGNAAGAALPVNPKDRVYVSAVIRADAGTAGLTLYDVTNGAAIGSVTHTGETFAHVWLNEAVPDTCEEVQVLITGVGATDNIYCDHVCGPYIVNNTLVRAPSWLDEAWRLKKVRRAFYTNAISSQVEAAASRRFEDWQSREEVLYENIPGATHENTLSFRRGGLPAGDIWIEAERNAYDLTSVAWANTAAGEAYTTSAPRDELVYTVARDVVVEVLNRFEDAQGMQNRLVEINRRLNGIVMARESELPPADGRTIRGFARV